MSSIYKEKKAIAPDDVEKWAEWLDRQPKTTGLTNQQLHILMVCAADENRMENDEEAKRLVAPCQYNLASMFYNRVIVCHTYKVSVAVAIFISEIADRPGMITIYANYLQYKAWKSGKMMLRMKDIGEIFSNGVFSKETLEQAWEKQKRYGMSGSDNMLDYCEAQKSIELK